MKQMYFSPDLLKELVGKVERANATGKCILDAYLHNRRRRAIEGDANSHSYAMEHPCRSTPKKCKREIKKGAGQLEGAYLWGISNIDAETFDEGFVRELAGRVDPVLHRGIRAAYRTCEARIVGYSYSPESPEKLDREMWKFVEEIKRLFNGGTTSDILSAAVYAHLHLVRIHPFVDTNGRTARTLQNVILDSGRIPIPVIHSGEKRDYHAHIERAKLDWRERVSSVGYCEKGISEGEREFNDFIGGKILVSLDTILKNSH